MKQILQKQNTHIGIIFICIIVVLGLMTQGCQQEYDDNITDSKIITSSELEDYIIIASDLYQSLKTFEIEFASITLSDLETVIENGRKVTYLPASVRSLDLEKKVDLLNRTKENLLKRYPQIRLQSFNDFGRILNDCIEQSVEINDFFLDKNINFHQPRTRAVVGEYSFDNQNGLVGFLYNWVLSPDYVEVVIYFFTDGTHLVILDDRNTVGSNITAFDAGGSTGNYYYDGKKIVSVGHTHMSSSNPSDADYYVKNNYQGIGHFIYYNGAFHYY